MDTYLTIWFSSEGATPMEITKRLNSLGFKEMRGNYDYSYSWDGLPSVEELLRFGDAVQKELKGTKATFKMETV